MRFAQGVDALGFIFYEPSPRYVHPGHVSEIVSALPPFVTPVGVFVNKVREDILAIVRSTGLRAVQLHGDGHRLTARGIRFRSSVHCGSARDSTLRR